jgi:peptide/nickel transport system permease protein
MGFLHSPDVITIRDVARLRPGWSGDGRAALLQTGAPAATDPAPQRIPCASQENDRADGDQPPIGQGPADRLQAPSAAHPFGTDALGRDLLARIAHGALNTLAIALAVSVAALVAGVLLGLLPRLSAPLVDTVNAVPAVLAGLLVTGIAGSGPWTPAFAVAVVAWSPLATHTSALLQQERGTTHLTATRALGAGRWYLLWHELLPAVLPPVTRHALLRLPGIALSLAALGFLGLGAQPPSPEWGLLLAENQPYAERAPWAVLFPAAVLALLGALAVTAAGGIRLPRRRKRPANPSGTPGEADRAVPERERQPNRPDALLTPVPLSASETP